MLRVLRVRGTGGLDVRPPRACQARHVRAGRRGDDRRGSVRARQHATHTCHAACNAHLSRGMRRTPVMRHARRRGSRSTLKKIGRLGFLHLQADPVLGSRARRGVHDRAARRIAARARRGGAVDARRALCAYTGKRASERAAAARPLRRVTRGTRTGDLSARLPMYAPWVARRFRSCIDWHAPTTRSDRRSASRPSAARRTRVLWRRPRGARCNAARRVASRSAAQRGRDAFFCRRCARRARCLVAAARRRSWRRR